VVPATGPVDVSAAPVPAEVASACQRLAALLPQELGPGLTRRPVTGDPARTAAWGDPPVTLLCGATPAGLPGVDGEPFELGPPGAGTVAFLQDDVGAANLFTTRDRAVPVAVLVPDTADAQALVPLAGAILQTLPAVPTG